MNYKKTFNNQILIKLDGENNKVHGLYIDTSYNPEMHATVTGTVFGLPSKLQYTGKPNIGMPWLTDIELSYGEKVIMYYLSVMNALNEKQPKYVREGDDIYILVPYSSIFAKYGDDWVLPVNGYCLIEPCEDPAITRERDRMKAMGMDMVVLDRKNMTDVVYGKVRYVGTPNKEYVDYVASDEGVSVAVGDTIVMRKVSDIPLCYELHQKVNSGKKLYRVQRRQMLAKL